MTQIKYARAVAIFALAVFPTQIWGRPIVCIPRAPDACHEKSNCITIDDEIDVAVEPNGQIYLNGENVSRNKLKEDAAVWAREGTWPIVVQGHSGTKYAQITSIVAMLRKAGVKTRISCVATQP